MAAASHQQGVIVVDARDAEMDGCMSDVAQERGKPKSESTTGTSTGVDDAIKRSAGRGREIMLLEALKKTSKLCRGSPPSRFKGDYHLMDGGEPNTLDQPAAVRRRRQGTHIGISDNSMISRIMMLRAYFSV